MSPAHSPADLELDLAPAAVDPEPAYSPIRWLAVVAIVLAVVSMVVTWQAPIAGLGLAALAVVLAFGGTAVNRRRRALEV